MKGTNLQIKTAWLAGVVFLPMAAAQAQEVTLLHRVEAIQQQIPDPGQYVSGSLLDLAGAGMASITDVDVSLSLSSLPQNNPMWLGQIYASLTYGVASEGVRTAVLLNRPGVSDANAFGSSLSSLNVTFDDSATANIFNVASGTGTYQADGRLGVDPYAGGVVYHSGSINAGLSALNGSLLQNQKLSLLVADTQQGAVAKLDSWSVKVTGTAASSGLLNLGAGGSVAATAGSQSVGATVVSSGTGSGSVSLLAAANRTLNLSGGLSGNGEFNKTGSGTVRVGDSSGFSGTLNVNEGKVVVDGTLASGSTTSVGSGGLLGGSGSLGALTVASGGTLTPGNSPGLLTVASATFQSGANYNWEIFNPAGSAGVGWDLLSVTGDLNVSALSSGSMNLVLQSLSALPGTVGALAGYSAVTPYSWIFAQAATITGIGLGDGLDVTSLFSINTSGFNNGTGPEQGWKVVTGSVTLGADTFRTLELKAVPEPSSHLLLGLGGAALIGMRALRRKRS